MNIYNAIMKAADHIERNPAEFNFGSVYTPNSPGCGTPGCALGWIGAFAGVRGVFYEAAGILGLKPEMRNLPLRMGPHVSYDFYNRMDAISGDYEWHRSAVECARVLRLYAEKYHGEEKPKPVSPPDWNAIAANWTIGDDVRSQEVAA